MDELYSIEAEGMVGISDDLNLRKQVEDSIVEAVVKTHKNAPSFLLEGISGLYGVNHDLEFDSKGDGIITISMLKDTLRIISVKAKDSDIVVCNFLPEDSAEGRKQLNKYVRGVPDDPRVVMMQTGADDYRPILKYYTSAETGFDAIDLTFVPYPIIEETMVNISPKLEYAVLNEIVAMILDNMSLHDKAAIYRNKSVEYMAI
jgi:hypothetical protein